MTNIIHEENGTLDKYEGDAIIAFWNAPLEVPKHGVKAVRAAIRCQKILAEMRPGFKKRIGKEISCASALTPAPSLSPTWVAYKVRLHHNRRCHKHSSAAGGSKQTIRHLHHDLPDHTGHAGRHSDSKSLQE